MRHKQRSRSYLRAEGINESRLRLLRTIMQRADQISSTFQGALTAPLGLREMGPRESGLSESSSVFVLSQLRRLVTGTICGWGRFDSDKGDGVVYELLVARGDVRRSGVRANATQVLRHLKAGQIVLPSQLVAPGKVWVAFGRPPVCSDEGNTVSELVAIREHELTLIYGVISRIDSGILCLFAGRPNGRTSHTGLYRSDEILSFQLVVDLLKREIESRQTREWLEIRSEAALRVLDRLHLGVVVVDQRCEPVLVNSWARELIARSDGLAVGPDGLRATRKDETLELRRLLGASAPSGERAAVSAGQMRISRLSGERSLSVRISPLRVAGSAAGREQPVAAVFICDPEQSGSTTDEALQQLYGLTKAEAHIALLLGKGTRLVEASKILGITTDTARTHLKRIFSKTGTAGQVELVHLLLSHMVISPDGRTQ